MILSRKWKFIGGNTKIQEAEGSCFSDVVSHTGPFISAAGRVAIFLKTVLVHVLLPPLSYILVSIPAGSTAGGRHLSGHCVYHADEQ